MLVAARKSCSVVFAALLLPVLLFASATARADQLPIKVYTRADGLSYSHIGGLAQDSRGFLWICTGMGLNRFDGYRFTTYGPEHGLSSPSFYDLLETRGGVYWVASNGGGVYRFNPHASSSAPLFTPYSLGDDPAANRVNNLYEDSLGRVWAATDAGLFGLDETDGESRFIRVELGIPEHPDRLAQVWSFVEDSEGSLWIGTKFGLVRRLPDGRMLHYTIQTSQDRDFVTSLLQDREGRLWLGHESLGLLVFKPMPISSISAAERFPWRRLARPGAAKRQGAAIPLPTAQGEALLFTSADGLGSNNVRTLLQTSDGHIWAGTVNGLNEFDGGRFRNYTTVNGLSSNVITALLEDRDGSLWIGTRSGGAMRFSKSGFVSYGREDGIDNDQVRSILEDQSGKLYVIIADGSLNRLDGERFTGIRPNLPGLSSVMFFQDAVQDRAGEWWLATLKGLYRFPKVDRIEQLATVRPKAVYTTANGLADNDIRRIYLDSRGDLWINTFAPGREVLTRWDRATEKFYRYSDANGLPPFRSAWTFCEDRQGNVWIGFRNGPLARYAAGRFTVFTTDDGLPPGDIHDLHLDHAGRLWVASAEGGLSRIEDPDSERPVFFTYTKDQGLIGNYISCVAEDEQGNIYAGTTKGVDRLDPATGSIKHYTAVDGLSSTPRFGYRDRHGSLWFGTLQGLSRLIPQTKTRGPSPDVLIGGLRVAGVQQPLFELGETEVSGLELGPEQNHIQIDYFSLILNQAEALRYQFKIEGVDQDWGAPTDQRSVNLTLAPGTYRFLVRVIGGDGAISQSPASVGFRILPPIWRRGWFIAIAAVVITLAAALFARSRAKRLKALRESENRFRALAETASDAIFVLDDRGKIIFVNLAAESMFGFRIDEALDKDMGGLIPRYRLAGFGGDGEASLDISWDARELRGIHKSGREIPLELSFGQFTRNNKRYFTVIARDVTERKRAEEALRKSREERLVELEQMRRRIATDLHDDIGSSLSHIYILSEVVRQRAARDDEAVTGPLAMISNASHELVNSMSDIVWAINPRKDHLSDLAKRMRRFASDIFAARNITCHFRAPDAERDVRLGSNTRREVFLIFKESVNNLVRHSGCSEADIEFQIDETCLMLRVSDNGRGFDVKGDGDGHGLLSMRARAQEIGGRLEITSSPDLGTTVTLHAPLGQAPAQPHAETTNTGGDGAG